MPRRSICGATLLTLLLAAAPLAAEPWLKVQSPHFTVVTNGSPADGRHIAGQLERLRAAFHSAFPNMRVDLPVPVEVLALVGEPQFRAVEPRKNIGLGKPKLQGLWIPAEDRNLILLRIHPYNQVLQSDLMVTGFGTVLPKARDATMLPASAPAPLLHPDAALYKAYATLLIAQSGQGMPLWLRTGLAAFYENSNLVTQKVMLGLPNASNLRLLGTYRLIPLRRLFADTAGSPDNRDPVKTEYFDAECWAITHYLFFHGTPGQPALLPAYLRQVDQGTDPVTAAQHVFGNLDQLESALENSMHGLRMPYAELNVSGRVNEKTFAVQKISQAQADGVRAEVLVRVRRYRDAEALLAAVLKANPANVRAIEDEGWLAVERSNPSQAETWFARAAALDTGNFMPRFEYATLDMERNTGAADLATDSADLQTAIKLNPGYAPAYDRLAMLELRLGTDLRAARLLELQAINLDPVNYDYRLDIARVFMAMNQPENVILALNAAKLLTRSDADRAQSQALMQRALAHKANLTSNSAAPAPTVSVQPAAAAPGPADLPSDGH